VNQLNKDHVEFIRLVCMLMILNELQRKKVTHDYSKLSFKNIFN
jgi:hypothetical protein